MNNIADSLRSIIVYTASLQRRAAGQAGALEAEAGSEAERRTGRILGPEEGEEGNVYSCSESQSGGGRGEAGGLS